MLCWAGGVSGLEMGLVWVVALLPRIGSVEANNVPAPEDGIPAANPSAADLLSNSLRFITLFHSPGGAFRLLQGNDFEDVRSFRETLPIAFLHSCTACAFMAGWPVEPRRSSEDTRPFDRSD